MKYFVPHYKSYRSAEISLILLEPTQTSMLGSFVDDLTN